MAEVVIIWNSGKPPDTSGWAAPGGAPVRLRLSPRNELTNRFLPDPLLRTRAVLTLDDDILSTCADVEALFAAWRRDPGLLAGMFPRLAGAGPPAAYAGEQEVYRRGRYNMVLTGGMVLDADRIFPLFNSPQYAEGERGLCRCWWRSSVFWGSGRQTGAVPKGRHSPAQSVCWR